MTATAEWQPVEAGSVAAALAACPQPFPALVAGDVPAVVLRGVLAPQECAAILRRLRDRDVIQPRVRADSFDYVGTSLGILGAEPDQFFAHATATHAMYATLFEGLRDPVALTYTLLNALAAPKQVVTAYEPDGRRYGPGIFRYYSPGAGHPPHFDSVRLREKRMGYEVYRFEHQFASILCLQGPDPDPEAGECLIHRCPWTAEIQPHIEAQTFHAYAAAHAIPHIRIELQPGDFYVFNTRHIHEVPELRGDRWRIVLATFMGYSPDEPEVHVWS